ncbi:hypothetical protein NDU88_011034 [Pleurodeles waltl]|uniref:Uncharacterized protein n=1 Tax=Pleurodeles waltl TaxID=8319 RepID=A0AAV7QZ85_PLEWA|nr:hypothetical protein NDU88_011034 [Pleurodeles waltl]
MRPAGLRQARWPGRRRVLQAKGQRVARRDLGRAPAVDPCRRGADGALLIKEEDIRSYLVDLVRSDSRDWGPNRDGAGPTAGVQSP